MRRSRGVQRRGAGAAAVLRLVRARLLGRRSAAALVALAVAGAIVVVGSLFGVAVVTADLATQRAMADLDARDRAIQVNRFTEGPVAEARADEAVRTALRGLDAFSQPLLSAVSFQTVIGFESVVGLDDLRRWAVVTEGRLPEPCGGATACEAAFSSEFESDELPGLGDTIELGEMRLTIVGLASLRPDLPLGLSELGAVVLTDGAAALADSAALADLNRTRFWVAPLDPARTHAWSLAGLRERIDGVERALAAEDRTFVIRSPDVAFGTIQDRTATAAGRLVFIGSLIVAVLLAFAVFAAAVERDDVNLEYRRLRVQGSSVAQRTLFVAAEASIPSIVGALVGWLLAAGIVAGIGLVQGATPLDILGVSLFEPVSLAVIGTVALLAALAVGLGIHPDSGRLIRPRAIALAVVPVAAVLIWDRLSRGQVVAAELAEQATGPGTVLLPGFIGLSVILGSLVVMPPIFRRLARASRRAPLPVRLSLVSIAREPLRPTATMTLLAFSLGAAVFALVYASTLRQGASDTAAFATGMDLRVQSYGPGFDFVPAVRFALEQEPAIDVELHPIHSEAARTASGRQLTVVGIEPAAIPRLRGWRSDFSGSSPDSLAAAIAQPGDWRLAGHDLPVSARELRFDVEASGDPIQLTAVVERDDGVYVYLPLGELVAGRHEMRAELYQYGFPTDVLHGWRVVAVLATNGGPAAAIGPRAGERQQATVRFDGLDGLFGSDVSHDLDVSGAHRAQLLRPAEPTDGIVLPAIISPELADDVDAGGVLLVQLGDGIDLAVRPMATTHLFPTVTEPARNLVIVDGAPLATLLNADAPGSGAATDLLVRADDTAQLQSVAGRLDDAGFPDVALVSRSALETEQALDPFALGVAWSLAVGSLAGISLSLAGILLAASARLQDERGDLGELEEQGVAPVALARLAVLQTVLVAVLGLAVGAVIGLGLGWLIATSIAVGGSGALPMPPLRLAAPWAAIGALLAAVAVGLATAVSIIARRHFSGALLRESRR